MFFSFETKKVGLFLNTYIHKWNIEYLSIHGVVYCAWVTTSWFSQINNDKENSQPWPAIKKFWSIYPPPVRTRTFLFYLSQFNDTFISNDRPKHKKEFARYPRAISNVNLFAFKILNRSYNINIKNSGLKGGLKNRLIIFRSIYALRRDFHDRNWFKS